jgi:hypothetical protein
MQRAVRKSHGSPEAMLSTGNESRHLDIQSKEVGLASAVNGGELPLLALTNANPQPCPGVGRCSTRTSWRSDGAH